MVKPGWPKFGSWQTLSADEVAELAARIAALTKAGMPLGEGLRAAADELPPGRLSRAVRRLAERFDAGDDLAAALGATAGLSSSAGEPPRATLLDKPAVAPVRLPAHLVGLMLAGARTGRLAEVLEEFVALEQGRAEIRRRIRRELAYPLVLLVMLAGVTVIARLFIVDDIANIVATLGMRTPAITQLFLVLVGPAAWIMSALALVGVAMFVASGWTAGPVWLARLVEEVPLLGPLLRFGRLSGWSRLLAVLLEHQVPLPDALRLAAGACDASLAQGCREAAEDVEAGRPLAESLAARPQFPTSLIPLVRWGQQTPALADAFRAAADVFGRLAAFQGAMVETLLQPILLLVIAAFVSIFAAAILVPTLQFTNLLSGLCWWPGSTSWNFFEWDFGSVAAGRPGLAATAILAPILLGIAILVTQRLVVGPRRYHDDVLNVAIGMAGWILVAVGILGPLGLVPLTLPWLWVPWCLLAIFVLVAVVRKRRARQQEGLLWGLAAAAERGMPLAPVVEAFAAERPGGLDGWRAQRLAAMLTAGFALPDALRRSPGVLPPQVLPLVRVGCAAGALAPALRQAATVHNAGDRTWMSLLGKLGYLCLVPALGLTCFFPQIMTQLAKVCVDFRVPLPDETRWVLACQGYLVVWYLLVALFVGILIYAVARYLGWVQWDLPGLGGLARRNDTAMILDGLAVAAGQDRPMSEGLGSLAESYPKPAVGRRLRRAAAEVESGGDWCEGLFRHGLIQEADRAILQAAQRVGNLPWALREMADSSRRRLAYRVQALAQMLFPVVVLVFGLIVMLIALGIFRPLLALMRSLA
ncbi:MAG: type II secretion system F family protein [Thermoguttaceae bacterium]